jgi:hypothetical protein
MMLRVQFGIIGHDKELIKNVLTNIRRVPGDIRKVLDIIRNVSVKELCNYLLFNVFSI